MPGETGGTQIDRVHPADTGYTTPNASDFPQTEPSYYNISFLKPPLWKWEIAWYYFLGGISGGAYVIARMAERVGGKRFRSVAKVGSIVSLLALAPCPPLLIMDLGDPKRFHHMLRVFKPTSPMSLGSWILSGFSMFCGLAFVREIADSLGLIGRGRKMQALDKSVTAALDIAGVPLGIGLLGYTAVLTNSSTVPLWAQNTWMGPLFSSSAIATGAGAVSMGLVLSGHDPESPAVHALEKLDSAAHVVEAAGFVGFLAKAGKEAKPMTTGTMKRHTAIFATCLIASEVIKKIPVSHENRKLRALAASAAGLTAGFHLRWAIVYGGHESSRDPHAARASSAPRNGDPGYLAASARSHKFPKSPTPRPEPSV